MCQNLAKGESLKLMNCLEETEREAFILRIWKSHQHNSPLLGQIQHVRSGRVFLLEEPEKFLTLLQEQVKTLDEKKSIPTGIK